MIQWSLAVLPLVNWDSAWPGMPSRPMVGSSAMVGIRLGRECRRKDRFWFYWWRAQSMTYLVRFNEQTRKAVDQMRIWDEFCEQSPWEGGTELGFLAENNQWFQGVHCFGCVASFIGRFAYVDIRGLRLLLFHVNMCDCKFHLNMCNIYHMYMLIHSCSLVFCALLMLSQSCNTYCVSGNAFRYNSPWRQPQHIPHLPLSHVNSTWDRASINWPINQWYWHQLTLVWVNTLVAGKHPRNDLCFDVHLPTCWVG